MVRFVKPTPMRLAWAKTVVFEKSCMCACFWPKFWWSFVIFNMVTAVGYSPWSGVEIAMIFFVELTRAKVEPSGRGWGPQNPPSFQRFESKVNLAADVWNKSIVILVKIECSLKGHQHINFVFSEFVPTLQVKNGVFCRMATHVQYSGGIDA